MYTQGGSPGGKQVPGLLPHLNKMGHGGGEPAAACPWDGCRGVSCQYVTGREAGVVARKQALRTFFKKKNNMCACACSQVCVGSMPRAALLEGNRNE